MTAGTCSARARSGARSSAAFGGSTSRSPSLWTWQPGAREAEHWPLPKPPGSFALRKDGGFLFAFRSGLATLDKPGGEVKWLDGVELGDERFNDGKTDRAGRFWAGTMDRKLGSPIGGLYRVDARIPGARCWIQNFVTIANGIGWSPDDRTMYFTDTPSRRIYRYDFDRASGAVSNRRVFVEVEPGHGGPDGMTVDAEGFVWSAQFDRGCVNRYAPDGKLERSVRMPVQRPTTLHVRRSGSFHALCDERELRRGGAGAGRGRFRAANRAYAGSPSPGSPDEPMNKALAGKVAVVGVGTTRYGKLPEYDAYDLGVWALKAALDDCGLRFEDIDGLIINRIPDYQRFGEITGINPRYVSITPGQGRFSGICIQTAAAVIAAGLAQHGGARLRQ